MDLININILLSGSNNRSEN